MAPHDPAVRHRGYSQTCKVIRRCARLFTEVHGCLLVPGSRWLCSWWSSLGLRNPAFLFFFNLNNWNLFLTVLKARKSKIRVEPTHFFDGEGSLLGLQTAAYLHEGCGGQG